MKTGIGCLLAGLLLASVIVPVTGDDGQTPKDSNPKESEPKSGESKTNEGSEAHKTSGQTTTHEQELPDDFDPAAAPIEYANCSLPKAARETVTIPFARGVSSRTIFVFPVLLARTVRYHDGETNYDAATADVFLNKLAGDDVKSVKAIQIEYELQNLAITERAAVSLALERQLGKQNIVFRSPRFTEQQVTTNLLYDNREIAANGRIPLTTGEFTTRFIIRNPERRGLSEALRDDAFRNIKKLQLELSIPYQVRAQVRVSSVTMDTTLDAVASAIQDHVSTQSKKPEFLVGIRGGKIDNNWLINEQLRTDVLLSFSRRRGVSGSLLSVTLLEKLLSPALENLAISEAKTKERMIMFVSESGFSASVSIGTITSLTIDDFAKKLKATEWKRESNEERQRDHGLELSAVIPDVGTFTQKGNYNTRDKMIKDELDKMTLDEIRQIKASLTGSVTHVQALSIGSFGSIANQFDRYMQFLDVVDFNQISVARYRVAIQPAPIAEKLRCIGTKQSVPSKEEPLDTTKPYLASGGGWHSGSDYLLNATARINYVPGVGNQDAKVEVVVRVVVKLKIGDPYGDASTWVRETRSAPVSLKEMPEGWEIDMSKIGSGLEECSTSATMTHTASGYAELRGTGILQNIQIYLSSNGDTGHPKGCLHFSVEFGEVLLPLRQMP